MEGASAAGEELCATSTHAAQAHDAKGRLSGVYGVGQLCRTVRRSCSEVVANACSPDTGP